MTTTSDTVELCTFPDDDKDYCKSFAVPTKWLVEVLHSLGEFNERKGVDLDNFLENYVWDETWFLYLWAKSECVLAYEYEQA